VKEQLINSLKFCCCCMCPLLPHCMRQHQQLPHYGDSSMKLQFPSGLQNTHTNIQIHTHMHYGITGVH